MSLGEGPKIILFKIFLILFPRMALNDIPILNDKKRVVPRKSELNEF